MLINRSQSVNEYNQARVANVTNGAAACNPKGVGVGM